MKPASAVDSFLFQEHRFFVKRDDLIDPLLSGNKYRKLYTLLQTPSDQITKLISYGGSQSNAMLSLAALCKRKSWLFDYYTKTLSTNLQNNISGNLKMALELGMNLLEIPHDQYQETISELKKTQAKGDIVVAQGGADPLAERGISQLAEEIRNWQESLQINTLNVVTPSGTGTTAFYLAKHLPKVNVLTTPAVGSSNYLIQQISALGPTPENLITLESQKKYHFAKPYPDFIEVYRELLSAGIEFDLLYGTKMWLVLLEHLKDINGEILYVHSGGILGNPSMLNRYQHLGI